MQQFIRSGRCWSVARQTFPTLFFPMTHTALMHCLHLPLATVFALLSCSSLVCLFLSLPSFSMLFLVVCAFPSDCHFNAVVPILLLSIRKAWLIQLHLVCIITSIAFVVSALPCNSSFDIVSGHLILNIFNVCLVSFCLVLLYSKFHCRRL
jgi:hypothetical protein